MMVEDIKNIIHQNYQLNIMNIKMHRESIGIIYDIETPKHSYIFKLYRAHTHINVALVVQIMNYLSQQHVYVPKIIQNQYEEYMVNYKGQKGVLFEHIKGEKIDCEKHMAVVIKSHETLIKAMKGYSGVLPKKDQSFYIDRYIQHLQDVNYPKQKIEDLKQIGHDLFKNILTLDQGFFHGDFHNENMMLDSAGHVYLFDFDACGILASQLDLVVFLDKTNFNHFKADAFEETMDLIRNRMSEENIKALMAFIPVRHYEIIATIIHERQMTTPDFSFYDQQYHWIKSFYDLWMAL